MGYFAYAPSPQVSNHRHVTGVSNGIDCVASLSLTGFDRESRVGTRLAFFSFFFFFFFFWNPIYCLVSNFISTYATPLAPNVSSAPASLAILGVCQLAHLVMLYYCPCSRKFSDIRTKRATMVWPWIPLQGCFCLWTLYYRLGEAKTGWPFCDLGPV